MKDVSPECVRPRSGTGTLQTPVPHELGRFPNMLRHSTNDASIKWKGSNLLKEYKSTDKD